MVYDVPVFLLGVEEIETVGSGVRVVQPGADTPTLAWIDLPVGVK